MTSDPGQDGEHGRKATAVKAATWQTRKTDAVPHFPCITDSPDEGSEGSPGNIANPKFAIEYNLVSEKIESAPLESPKVTGHQTFPMSTFQNAEMQTNKLQVLDNSVPETELTCANNSQSDAQSPGNTNVKSVTKTPRSDLIMQNSIKPFLIPRIIAGKNIVESCKNAAKRLSNIITWVKDNDDPKILLREFAHSASCGKVNCTSFCKLFQRLRKHVMSAKHKCTLLRLYSLLLRLHVNACTNNNCGLQACPILRSRKQLKQNECEKAESVTRKSCSNYKIKSKKTFLISRIVASETGNKLVIFLAKPIKTMNIPLPSPPISELAE